MKVYWDSLKQDIQFLLAFLLAIVVFVAMVIFIYPGDEEAVLQISGFSEMGDWEASYGIVFGEDAPYKFWLAFLIFSFIGIFYVALPVLSGTTIVSKDVDNNTIDLLMGNPLSKRRVFIEKLLEVLTISSIPILVLFLSLLAFSWFIGQNIAVTLLFAACIQLLPLTCGIAILSSFFSIFFLSADRARKFMAIIVVGSFLISLIVSYSEELEFLKYFQVFYYYDSPQTLLKPSFDKISWNKSIIMIIFSLVMFCFCFYINEKKDYFPHYSHKIKEKTKKDTGIPLLFFYSRKFQERFPCFVEELQSDKLIIYIFGIVLIISGLITPSMYPGDSAWLPLRKTYN
ncbi:MAG: ABC transporter permease subunit, partial [Candidatus Hodarchaeota archaeon]